MLLPSKDVKAIGQKSFSALACNVLGAGMIVATFQDRGMKLALTWNSIERIDLNWIALKLSSLAHMDLEPEED